MHGADLVLIRFLADEDLNFKDHIKRGVLRMLSRYIGVKERDGIVALFHQLHPEPTFCSLEDWEKIRAGQFEELDTIVDELRHQKLIIDASEEDDKEFGMVVVEIEGKLNQTTILYLMTAQGCNFGCKYCPVPEIAKKYGASILSIEDALAGIDLWGEHLKESYDSSLPYFVIFYGGEPLLNKEVVKSSLYYLEAKKEKGVLPTDLNIMIATNGVLVDDDTIALCQEHKVSVAVGLDGPISANDILKVDRDGRGTFDRIIESIELLVRNKIKTFASVSITPFNIDHIARYSEFFEELGIEKFGFNFLKGRLLLDLVGSGGLEQYYRKASRGIIENARRQNRHGFEYQMEKKQIAFDSKNYFPVDCTCLGNQLVIQPDGEVSNCPFFKSYLGLVRDVGKDFRIWKQPIVKEWRKRLSLYNGGEAKAICGAGCAWSSAEIKGSFLAIDDSSRIFSEEVFDEIIWSRYIRET